MDNSIKKFVLRGNYNGLKYSHKLYSRKSDSEFLIPI
jgi:hypothetical protein